MAHGTDQRWPAALQHVACILCLPCLSSCLLHAGRAAEELLYGLEEMSTINQRQLSYARRIAQKLVVAGGMSEHPLLAARTLSVPLKISDRHFAQAVYDDVRCGSGLPWPCCEGGTRLSTSSLEVHSSLSSLRQPAVS